MDIFFNCDQCHQQLVVDAAGEGLIVPCPQCGWNLKIPSASHTPHPGDTAAANDKKKTIALTWTPPGASPKKSKP